MSLAERLWILAGVIVVACFAVIFFKVERY